MKSTPFLVAVIIIILGVGGISYYHNWASSTIAYDEDVIASLESQATSLGSQLTSANAKIMELQTQGLTDSTQITSLQSQLNTATGQATSLQSELTSANEQITSLQTQLSAANSQVSSQQSQLNISSTQLSSLQSQLSTATTQVTTLQSEKANLQNIVDLSLSTAVLSSTTVSQSTGDETLVTYFTPGNAGYIYVSGTSTTTTSFIRITGSYGGYSYTSYCYNFGSSSIAIVPVLPGTVYIYLGNTDSSGTSTAYFSITYYY